MYYLHVNLEATPDEMALVKKHQFDSMPFCESMFLASRPIDFDAGYFVGKSQRLGFKSLQELAHAESQIIENAKKLKQQLEAASSYTSGGPREIAL